MKGDFWIRGDGESASERGEWCSVWRFGGGGVKC